MSNEKSYGGKRVDPKILSTLEYRKVLHRLEQHASTSLGKTMAMELKPKMDFEEVKEQLQATDQACLVERLKGSAPFGGIRDIRAAIKRARIGGMLHPSELLEIATTLQGGKRLKRFILNIHEDHGISILATTCSYIEECSDLEHEINRCIDDHANMKDSASPELGRVRQELRTGEMRVRERLEQMIRNSSVQKMLQDSLITIRNDRFVIPVKQEYRNHFGGLIHDQSASGATLFIEPEAIVALNNKIRELQLREEQEIEKILRKLTALVAEEADILAANADYLAQMDFIFAKAGLAREMKAVLPRMNDRGFMKISKGRHPLIAADVVVPIDIELGNQYHSIIVTGPNTGGKTVSLKTIGLLSLMAMSGLFIPAEEDSQLCVFDGIYADIGDEQSIEQNLSTFSSHMTNIIRILREMTPKSLVLLDEVGAGTDPSEGSALAIAILEHIHQTGCRMVATTHYSELKAYAYERKGVINASMEFDIMTLKPTYRLLIGVPGRSNAFAIAKRLGLQAQIIEHARGQLSEESARVESMIATLEENRAEAERDRKKAEEIRREYEKLQQELQKERERWETKRSKLLVHAEQEARQVIDKARTEAEQVIADLRKIAMEERSSLKEHKLIDAKKRLDQAVPERSAVSPSPTQKGSDPISLGDEVRVHSLGQKGYVVELGDDGALVQLGILKMKVAMDDLALVTTANTAQGPKGGSGGATVKRSRDAQVRTELDLRGANLEEALLEVDQFLDESLMNHLGQVYIIHGKGTGVLRKGITEFLRTHKHVKQFRTGAHGEGGNGVTVVEL